MPIEIKFMLEIITIGLLLSSLVLIVAVVICGILAPFLFFWEWITTRKTHTPSTVYWDPAENHIRHRNNKHNIW